MTDDVKERMREAMLAHLRDCAALDYAVDAALSALRPGDEINGCVLVPKDREPSAWIGWFPGCGSVNSHHEITRHRSTMENWWSGAEITPLYSMPMLAAEKEG